LITSKSLAIGLIIGVLLGAAIGVYVAPSIFGTSTQIESLNAQIKSLQTTISQKDSQIAALQGKILSGEIKLGGLLPLSGDLASYGQNSKAAVELAVSEVNDFLNKTGAGWRFKLMVEDTQTSATTCLAKVTSLYSQGVKLFVGPQASGELKGIKAYCDANKLLVISQSSTSPALSIADDFIYRFCPDDNIQGPAIARMMYDSGVRYVIPVYRADAWGDGLKDATKAVFEKLGGHFLEGVRYSVEPTPATFTVEASSLASKVSSAVSQYGANKVGVLIIAFEEATRFFLDAREHSVLWNVKWFGSDGTVQLDAMAKEASVAEFAVAVKFPNTIYAPTVSAKYEKVRLYCNNTLGRMPDAYVYAAYDSVWVLALCLLQVNKYDTEAIRAVLPTVAQNYFGASGWVVLNAAGDRAQADYDIWAIQFKDGKYEWVYAGTWIATSDSIRWAVAL